MSPLARVAIDPSQFPEAVRRDLVESLRSREINHKFHYESLRQTQKWLALHQAYSPSKADPNCAAIYQMGFDATVDALSARSAHLFGLCCGGGQKDAGLLEQLRTSDRLVCYSPCDGSVPMVLVARQAALGAIPAENCFPIVIDLASALDLRQSLLLHPTPLPADHARIFTFFGTVHNFEPAIVLPRLASLMGAEDVLLLSANLAPGPDYRAGVESVLPLYNNELTRDWLLIFLLDLGIEAADGRVRVGIETTSPPLSLQRIVATFEFVRERAIQLDSERFEFRSGETIRLFFSYRYTPRVIRVLLDQYGLDLRQQWVTESGEEGVFLVRKQRG
ncbi:MAG TPA: L-histidine N(alpha)-methyltransferase [Verrucomicrobiae bacterium]|nr:L-histidine N(alpha)-methyltransferase [Verrucomicrobiae bacterium]